MNLIPIRIDYEDKSRYIPKGRMFCISKVCYDLNQLVNHFNNTKQDLPFFVPNSTNRMPLNFLREIAKSVLNFNKNIASYFEKNRDARFLVNNGLTCYDPGNKLELVIADTIIMNDTVLLMFLDILQPRPSDFILNIIGYEWTDTVKHRNTLKHLKIMYGEILDPENSGTIRHRIAPEYSYDMSFDISILQEIYADYALTVLDKKERDAIASSRKGQIKTQLEFINYDHMQRTISIIDESLNALKRVPGLVYSSLKYLAKFYFRNKMLDVTPLVLFLFQEILTNRNNSVVKQMWECKEEECFRNMLIQYLTENNAFVYTYTSVSKEEAKGKWNRFVLTYDKNERIVGTTFSPKWGIYYNQIRSVLFMQVIENMCRKGPHLLSLFFKLLKLVRKQNYDWNVFDIKRALLFLYDNLYEESMNELRNDFKIMIECIPETFHFCNQR